MSFTGGRLKLKGDDTGVKKKKKKKSKGEDESKALQLVEGSTAEESMPKVWLHLRCFVCDYRQADLMAIDDPIAPSVGSCMRSA